MPNEAKVQRIVNVPKQYFWDRLRAFGEIKTLLPENILEVKLPDTLAIFSSNLVPLLEKVLIDKINKSPKQKNITALQTDRGYC